jgi:hypothetical protein
MSDKEIGHRATSVRRRVDEFGLISRVDPDPGDEPSMFCSLFLFSFVIYPILRTGWNGLFDAQGNFLSLDFFRRYFDSYYGPVARQIFRNTMVMGILTAAGEPCCGSFSPILSCGAVFRQAHHHISSPLFPPFPPLRHCPELHSALREKRPRHPRCARHEFPAGLQRYLRMDGLVFVPGHQRFSPWLLSDPPRDARTGSIRRWRRPR